MGLTMHGKPEPGHHRWQELQAPCASLRECPGLYRPVMTGQTPWNGEQRLVGGTEQREDTPAPSREPARASLGFAKEEVALPGGPSWTNLSGHFLCFPYHGSAVGILKLWPFLWYSLWTCCERLGTLNQQAGPGLSLVSGARHCTHVPF